MPSLNLKTNKITYYSADVTPLEKAHNLLAVIAERDTDAKQDAQTAANALRHVIDHIKHQRNGKA